MIGIFKKLLHRHHYRSKITFSGSDYYGNYSVYYYKVYACGKPIYQSEIKVSPMFFTYKDFIDKSKD